MKQFRCVYLKDGKRIETQWFSQDIKVSDLNLILSNYDLFYDDYFMEFREIEN